MSRPVDINKEHIFTKKDADLCCLAILQRYSDCEHPLSLKEIPQLISQDYGFDIQERSLSSTINALIGLGYDIQISHDNNGKLYLGQRVFNENELMYLARLISNDKVTDMKNQVFDDLLGTLSNDESLAYKQAFAKDEEINPDTRKLFDKISTIDLAIKQKKKIEFYYYDYVFSGKKLEKQIRKDSHNRNKIYILSPYYTFLSNHEYYVLGNLETESPNKDREPCFFRIDYISNLGLLSSPIYPQQKLSYFKNFDLAKFVRQHHLLFIEDVKTADIILNNTKDLRYIHDEFGEAKDVVDYNLVSGQTHITLKNNTKSLIYFLLSHPQSFTLNKKNNNELYRNFKEELDTLVKTYYTPEELDALKDSLNQK